MASAGLATRVAAADDQIDYPVAVAVDGDGTVYVADSGLPGVWQLRDGETSIYFQGEKQFGTPLNAIRCLAIDNDGRLLAGDSATREVYRFDDAGQPQPLTDGGIGMPMGIAVTPQGQILVSDIEVGGIWLVPAEGGEPQLMARMEGPAGVVMDDQQRLYVVTRGRRQLYLVHANGDADVLMPERVFEFPHDIVLAADGQTALVADGYARAIWRLPLGEELGEPTKWVDGEPLVNPVGLAWRGDDLLVVDSRARAVFVVAPDGTVSRL